AGKETESEVPAVLLALFEEDLHPDADPEDRHAARGGLLDGRDEVAPADLLHRGAERAVAGKDQGGRGAQHVGVTREDRVRPCVPEALGHAAQVPDAVVDDRDHSWTGLSTQRPQRSAEDAENKQRRNRAPLAALPSLLLVGICGLC